jgi:hypothetical protein
MTSGLRLKVEETDAHRICVVCGTSVCCVGYHSHTMAETKDLIICSI